jgi:hypothetical protein
MKILNVTFLDNDDSLTLFTVFLVVDIFFITAFAFHAFGSVYFSNRAWSLEAEHGFSETYQYIKFGFLFISFLMLAKSKSYWGYYALAATCIYLLADDALMLHENLGRVVKWYLPGVRGGMTYSLIIGAICIFICVIAWWFGPKCFKYLCSQFIILLAALGFFGIVVDEIHAPFANLHPSLGKAVTVVEDGGEMIVASIMLAQFLTSLVGRSKRERSA